MQFISAQSFLLALLTLVNLGYCDFLTYKSNFFCAKIYIFLFFFVFLTVRQWNIFHSFLKNLKITSLNLSIC